MTLARTVLIVALASQVVFRSGADAVELLVFVRNGDRPVHDLTAADFALTDNGMKQTVTVAENAGRPVDITLCVSVDDDRTYKRADVTTAVGRLVRELRPEDRVRVLVTDDGVRDATGWLSGGSTYNLGAFRAGFASPMYDAAILAMAHQAERGRGNLVIGISRWYSGDIPDASMVADVARKATAVLHVVVVNGWRVGVAASENPGYSSQLFPRSAEQAGNRVAHLRAAAAATGGRFVEAGGSNPVYDSFMAALADFRDGYVLYYTPTGVPRSGWHDIAVSVPAQPRASVRTRSGYYLK